VHDGVVNNVTPKPAKASFNLTDSLNVAKNAKKPPSNNKTSGNKPRSSWASRPKREFTPLGEPLETVYKTLLQHELISPMDNPRPYNPQPCPPWWNETSYYEYHQNKGHKVGNCINLHHKIQDMIDNGELVVDGHHKNSDHKAFKEPFPPYEKGETSKTKPNNKINYAYPKDDNVINMVEPVDFD
jgi:hypothetical protein